MRSIRVVTAREPGGGAPRLGYLSIYVVELLPAA
jgi:hypothetical protein